MDAMREHPAGQEWRSTGQELVRRLGGLDAASRLPTAMQRLVELLHGVVIELRPSPEELTTTLGFLTEVGHFTDARRQEWVLLADVLGVSSLIEDLSAPRPAGATPNTVAGPFYRADVPEMPLDSDISRDGKGERLTVTGLVADLAGEAVPGALVEVWHANSEGEYENQGADRQPELNLRGKFRTDAQGRFRFRSVKPKGYSLPSDGPVGRLMNAVGLSLERPAHIHFRVSVRGYETLTTHIFDDADPAIGRDPIFGVKPALLARFSGLPDGSGRSAYSLDLRLVLCPARINQPEALESTGGNRPWV